MSTPSDDLTLTNDTGIGIESSALMAFLAASASPEQIQLFIRSVIVLTDFALSEVQSELEVKAMLSSSGNYEISQLLVDMQSTVMQRLFEVVDEHGISVNEEIDFTRLVDLVEALYQITVTEYSDKIIQILEGNDSPEVLFAEILELTGSYSAEEYLNDVFTVSPKLLISINAIHELQLKRAGGDPSQLEQVALARRRLMHFHTFLGTNSTRVYRLFDLGLPANLPLKDYLDRYSNLFVSLPDTNAGVELYGFLRLSQQFNEIPTNAIEPFLEGLFGDLNRAQDIRRIIQNITQRYSAYLRTNALR